MFCHLNKFDDNILFSFSGVAVAEARRHHPVLAAALVAVEAAVKVNRYHNLHGQLTVFTFYVPGLMRKQYTEFVPYNCRKFF